MPKIKQTPEQKARKVLHAAEFARQTVAAVEAVSGPLFGKVCLLTEMRDANAYGPAFQAQLESRGVEFLLRCYHLTVQKGYDRDFPSCMGSYSEDIGGVDTVLALQPDGINPLVLTYMLRAVSEATGAAFRTVVAAPGIDSKTVAELASALPPAMSCDLLPVDTADGWKPKGADVDRDGSGMSTFVFARVEMTKLVPDGIQDRE